MALQGVGMRRVRPYEAFNLLKSESVLMIDCCATPAQLLPGAVAIGKEKPVSAAVLEAAEEAIETFCPDHKSIALLLDDSGDADNGDDRAGCTQGDAAAEALLTEGGCKHVLCVGRRTLLKQYAFLFEGTGIEASAYPSEILEDKLFLGSILAAEQKRLDDLGITHVVSVIDRKVGPLTGQDHLCCNITDDTTADLTPVMEKALPFITNALGSGGRVLVHCEQGRSRSTSVVVAYIMREHGISANEALPLVQQQRSCAQPNSGFMSQLRGRPWGTSNNLTTLPCKRLACELAASESCDPSAGALTEWILSNFSEDSTLPEHEAVKHAQMGDWLTGPVCTRQIRSRELLENLGVVLECLLTRWECKRIIAETERIGFGMTGYPRQYRGNRRLQMDDVSGALADKIWKRVSAYVPEQLTVDWTSEDGDYPSGTWRPVGCNTRFRFSKYFQGERFETHADSMCIFGKDRCCLLTVNIYLNDLQPAQHGRTRFFTERGGEPVDAAGGIAGSAILFKQEHALHDGEVLSSGLKYLMRTDVIFEKIA